MGPTVFATEAMQSVVAADFQTDSSLALKIGSDLPTKNLPELKIRIRAPEVTKAAKLSLISCAISPSEEYLLFF